MNRDDFGPPPVPPGVTVHDTCAGFGIWSDWEKWPPGGFAFAWAPMDDVIRDADLARFFAVHGAIGAEIAAILGDMRVQGVSMWDDSLAIQMHNLDAVRLTGGPADWLRDLRLVPRSRG